MKFLLPYSCRIRTSYLEHWFIRKKWSNLWLVKNNMISLIIMFPLWLMKHICLENVLREPLQQNDASCGRFWFVTQRLRYSKRIVWQPRRTFAWRAETTTKKWIHWLILKLFLSVNSTVLRLFKRQEPF